MIHIIASDFRSTLMHFYRIITDLARLLAFLRALEFVDGLATVLVVGNEGQIEKLSRCLLENVVYVITGVRNYHHRLLGINFIATLDDGNDFL